MIASAGEPEASIRNPASQRRPSMAANPFLNAENNQTNPTGLSCLPKPALATSSLSGTASGSASGSAAPSTSAPPAASSPAPSSSSPVASSASSSTTPPAPINLYVSPAGSDTNPGTISSPFLTLTRAQQQVRNLAPSAASDIYVYLRAGTYRLTQTLSFTPQDSGPNGHLIHWMSYPGETPVISGAIQATGWTQLDAGIWKTHIGQISGTLQMYVNGVRATRARTAAAPANVARSADGFTTTDLSVASLGNLHNVEMVTRWDYVWLKCPFDHVTVSAGTADVALSPQCLANAVAVLGPGFPAPLWIENAKEYLAAPGEWYFDAAAGDLYYMPQPSENLATADVEIPVVERLVSVMGQAGSPVQNIAFSGLTFAYATWFTGPDNAGPGTANGFASNDQDEYFAVPNHQPMPGNVDVEFSSNVNFIGDTFTHLGGTALTELYGDNGNAITGNSITDISGNGITVGHADVWQINSGAAVWYVSDITVNDNYVAYIDQDYPSGAAIVVSHGMNMSVLHNEVAYTPHMGIEIGFGLGTDDPDYSKNILIEYNLIHDFMQLNLDGGGIYLQDVVPGGEIAYNFVRDSNEPGKTFSPAIYLDLGNRYVEVHDNVTQNNAVSYFENVTHDTLVDALCYQNPPLGVATMYGPMRCSGDNSIHDNWFESEIDANGHNTSIQFTGCTDDQCAQYFDPTKLITLPAQVSWVNNSAQMPVAAPASLTSGAGIEAQWQATAHPDSLARQAAADIAASCRRAY